MAALSLASQLLYPVLGNNSQRSIPVNWFMYPAAPAVNVLLQLSTLEKMDFFSKYWQHNNGSSVN